ncbi:MAG: branched-chain amino acid aminotransferase [Candidatus Rokubacteria bacterium]|nr:branched-chain amino acid aminotransferase [Candidatus Rokubacteria bacterium]
MGAVDRIAYFNGRFVPEREVLVPFRDRGFKYGDAVFDTTRTFGHRVFKLQEHVERLYRSMRYLRIDPGLSQSKMIEVTEEVLRQNLPLIAPDDDYWVTQRVSRGLDPSAREVWAQEGATVIVECIPLPLKERASLYRDGIRILTPSVRRTPPESLSPRVKTHNYLNLIAGGLEVSAQDPGAWAVLLDRDGNLGEGLGSNIFLVQDRTLLTPREQTVLSGISRETVIDLAREAGLTVVEKDIDLYDAYNADECFLTSTSLCICPVASVNGSRIGDGLPGPVTRQLTEAYVRFVDFDFVAQYLKRLP